MSIEFTVSGRGSFPLDMLRYDQCCPAHPDDVAKLDTGERREITLYHNAPGHWTPTTERWRSFGWTVMTIDGLDTRYLNLLREGGGKRECDHGEYVTRPHPTSSEELAYCPACRTYIEL